MYTTTTGAAMKAAVRKVHEVWYNFHYRLIGVTNYARDAVVPSRIVRESNIVEATFTVGLVLLRCKD